VSVEMAILMVLEGFGPDQRIQVDQPELTIGRHEECDLVIPDRQVSRKHARIRQEEGHYVIEDLGSKNGTFVNGQELTGTRVLEDKDEIQIALCCRLMFVAADATVPVLPAVSARGLHLDLETKRVWVGGRELDPPLSLPQYRLLELLYQAPGRVCSRDQVVEAVWPEENRDGISEQAIDALARRLRERLAEIDADVPYVVTVRGHGFRLENAVK
jgi:DNA-binding winged helix-turn-helix (wHTH) protein